jgi:hypothetical protein
MATITVSQDLVIIGEVVTLRAEPALAGDYWYEWSTDAGKINLLDADIDKINAEVHWDTSGLAKGSHKVRVQLFVREHASAPRGITRGASVNDAAEATVILMENTQSGVISRAAEEVRALAERLPRPGTPTRVTLDTPAANPTSDQALWAAIRNRTAAIDFEVYRDKIDKLLCVRLEAELGPELDRFAAQARARGLGVGGPTIHGAYAYNVLKLATEIFLILEAGVVAVENRGGKSVVTLIDPDLFNAQEETSRFGREITREVLEQQLTEYFAGTRELRYLREIVETLLPAGSRKEVFPYCEGVLRHRFTCPSLIELIWSYWHEEGMLVQTMNAIALRFQNRRGSDHDPLANMEIDPLRPLNNMLWGYVQDEQHRLTIMRRAYEYDHHYGITLHGKAVAALRSADSRSKFIEAFHNLLHQCAQFYQQEADTTVVADGFPLLNSLKELHLILAEGAHNQFGDLPWTSRAEMLIQQWLLARPEMRTFLQGRAMVPYRQKWMGQVDVMKKLQNWTDVTVTHFHDLATFGEQVLLSVRYGEWNNVQLQDQAKNWARYWRPEIQGYVHAYRAVSGVDLTTDPVDANPPWVHLRARIEDQRKRVARA